MRFFQSHNLFVDILTIMIFLENHISGRPFYHQKGLYTALAKKATHEWLYLIKELKLRNIVLLIIRVRTMYTNLQLIDI